MNYEELFVNPTGRTARGPYIGALLTLLAAFAFYWLWVPGRIGQFAMLVMIYPGMVLHARRLHDMGLPGWPVFIPGVFLVCTGFSHLYNPGAEIQELLTLSTLLLTAVLVLWGLVGKSRELAVA